MQVRPRQLALWAEFLKEVAGAGPSRVDAASAARMSSSGTSNSKASRDIELRLQSMMQSKKGRDRLKLMVRGGIPAELRPRVWHFLAGASTKRTSQLDEQYYERLLESVDQQEAREMELRQSMASTVSSVSGSPKRSELAATLEQIDKDINRTFPGHHVIAAPEGQKALRRLLRAYCGGRNPHTGYCQGVGDAPVASPL